MLLVTKPLIGSSRSKNAKANEKSTFRRFVRVELYINDIDVLYLMLLNAFEVQTRENSAQFNK